jgi:hypothetical protein
MKTRKDIENRIDEFMKGIRKGLSYDAMVVLLANDIEEYGENFVIRSSCEQLNEKYKTDFDEFENMSFYRIGKAYINKTEIVKEMNKSYRKQKPGN